MLILFRSIILLSNLHNKRTLAIFLCFHLHLIYCLLLISLKMLVISLTSVLSNTSHPLCYCYLVMLAVNCYERNPSKLVPKFIIFQSPYLFIVEHGNQIFSHHDFCIPFYLSPLDFCSSSVFQELSVGRRELIWRVKSCSGCALKRLWFTLML